MKPKIWIAGAVVLAVLAGGGLFATKVFLEASEDKAVGLVPARVGAYVSLFVRPSNAQKMALEDLLGKFPQLGDSFEEARDALVDLLNPELKKIGLEFEADVDPWLGDQVALYVMPPEINVSQPEEGLVPESDPEAAAIISVRDEDAAREAVDKALASREMDAEDASYEGTDYSLIPDEGDDMAVGFLEDFMIVGSETALKLSVDAFRGESLSETDAYQEAFAGFEEDQLATMYFDTQNLVEAAVSGSPMSTEDKAGLATLGDSGPVAIAIHARSDSAVLESSLKLPDDPALRDVALGFSGPGADDVLRALPSETWFALGVPQLGRAVGGLVSSIEGASPDLGADELAAEFKSQTGLDLQEDVLSWMDGAGLFIQGTNLQEAGGALIIESLDPDKTRAVVDRIGEFVNSEQPGSAEEEEEGGLTGFRLRFGTPAPIHVLGGDRFIVAYGDRALAEALDPDEALGDGDTFGHAMDGLGSGYAPTFYLDMSAIPRVVESFLFFAGPNDSDTYEDDVEPVLEAFDYVVVGSKVDANTLLQRFVVGVREGDE